MSGLKMMMFDEGAGQEIRCRFISEWFKLDSYVSDKEGLIPEIKKLKPNAVILDMNLFDKIGGIETKRKIEGRFDFPIWYE